MAIDKVGKAASTKAPANAAEVTKEKRPLFVAPGKVQPASGGKAYFGAWVGGAPEEKEVSVRIPFTDTFVYSSYSQNKFKDKLNEFAALSGKKPKIVMQYQFWYDRAGTTDFPSTFCHEVSKNGQIPMLTWEAIGVPVKASSEKTYLDVISDQLEKKDGEIYDYVKSWAKQAGTYGKPFFLRPFHEMNLRDSYPWTGWQNGNADGPAKFTRAWKAIYNVFKEYAPNATFVWCPNNMSYPFESWNSMENYYPGNDFVDWVGVDGYRTEEGQKTFKDVFGEFLDKVTPLANEGKKPMIVCEVSSYPDAGKTGFIKDVLDTTSRDFQGLMLFNENKKQFGGAENNWNFDAALENMNTEEAQYGAITTRVQLAQANGDDKQKINEMLVFLFQRTGKSEQEAKILADRWEKTGSFRDPNAPVPKNPTLELIRSDMPNLEYEKTDVAINLKGDNVEADKTVILPDRMRKVTKRADKIDRYDRVYKHIFPVHKQISDVQIKMSALLDEISGYQIFKAKSGDDFLEMIETQRTKAIAELGKIKYEDRRYLRAIALMKNIYAEWKGYAKEAGEAGSKDLMSAQDAQNKRDKAKDIAQEMLMLTLSTIYPKKDDLVEALKKGGKSDEDIANIVKQWDYPNRFSNKILSLPIFFGAFNVLDTTMISKNELWGLRASAFATLGDVELEDMGKVENAKERVLRQYDAAEECLSKKSTAEKVIESFKSIDPGELILDTDKDLKYQIKIGRLRVRFFDATKDAKNINVVELDKVIKELDEIAFDKRAVSIGAKVKEHMLEAEIPLKARAMAKLYLAKVLAAYNQAAYMDNVKEDPVLQTQYFNNAKRAFAVLRELVGTEYAYEANQLTTVLAGQITETRFK